MRVVEITASNRRWHTLRRAIKRRIKCVGKRRRRRKPSHNSHIFNSYAICIANTCEWVSIDKSCAFASIHHLYIFFYFEFYHSLALFSHILSPLFYKLQTNEKRRKKEMFRCCCALKLIFHAESSRTYHQRTTVEKKKVRYDPIGCFHHFYQSPI